MKKPTFRGLATHVASSPFGEYVRRKVQTRRFEQVLNDGAAFDGTYSVERTQRALAARAADRVALPTSVADWRVLAFGLDGWGLFGLWPSLARVAKSEYVSLGELSASRGIQGVGPRQRESLTDACLEVVDRSLKAGPIHMVFIYVDSECLTPRLFHELARRRIWTVLLGLDDKHRFPERREHGMRVGQTMVLPHVDVAWTVWKSGTAAILSIGGNPWYAPEGADPKFHQSLDLRRDLDVVFIGQRYGERKSLVAYLRAHGFSVEAFGSGWHSSHLSFDETVQVFNRARVVLGVGGVTAMRGVQGLKGRDFEAPMTGAVYLTTYNPELADFYDIGREILCYSSKENCLEQLHWILKRPEEQTQIRQAARTRAMRDHTWERRWSELFRLFQSATRSVS